MKRALLVVLACIALAACGGGAGSVNYPPIPSTSPTPTSPATATATPTLTPVGSGTPKIPLRGLIDMQDISWHNTDNATPAPFTTQYINMFPGAFGGIVINETWADLQPTQGGKIVTINIDNDLQAVQTYNSASNTTQSSPVGVKLRIYAGSNAPLWAKNLPGGPVTIYRNPAGCNGNTDTCPLTVGPYWTTPYINAWRAFQAQVAQKYDSNPLIVAVAVTSCAEQTDEPFVPSSGPISKANLKAAGLTDALQQSCLSGAVTDYSAWQNTDIDFTFNSYNKLSGDLDSAFTETVMQSCRTAVGTRCVLDNHALETSISSDPAIYTTIQSMGGLINFQTQAPEGMGCLWPETITEGVILGARAIEVWPESRYQGFTTLTAPEIAQLKNIFYSPVPATTPVPSPLPAPCSGFN